MIILASIMLIYVFVVATILELLLRLLRISSAAARLFAGALVGFALIAVIGDTFPTSPEQVTSETETPFLLGTILGILAGAISVLVSSLTRKR
jgi:Na+/proline symporter